MNWIEFIASYFYFSIEIFLLQSQTSTKAGEDTFIKYFVKLYLQSAREITPKLKHVFGHTSSWIWILAVTLDLWFYNIEQILFLQLSQIRVQMPNFWHKPFLYPSAQLVKALEIQRAVLPGTMFFLGEGEENFFQFLLHQTQKDNEGKYKVKVTKYK